MNGKQLRPFAAGLAFFLVIGLPVAVAAEENSISFSVAPAPVGYPEFVKGERLTQSGGNAVYASTDFGEENLTLFGAMGFGSYQYSPTDSLALGASLGGSLLAGSDYDLLAFQFPVNATLVYEALETRAWSLFLFGGGGATIGVTTMTIPVMQVVNVTLIEDPTTLTTSTISGTVHLGAQVNLSVGKLIVSPFGTYTYSAGSYSSTQTSAMSFDYPSASGSVDGFSTAAFGFDVLHRPSGITLSSQLRKTDTSTLVSLALKWLLKRASGNTAAP